MKHRTVSTIFPLSHDNNILIFRRAIKTKVRTQSEKRCIDRMGDNNRRRSLYLWIATRVCSVCRPI